MTSFLQKPYKILHVLDSFGVGGAQEVVLNLLKYADRKRFDPEAATLYGKGTYWDKYRQLGVKVHSLSPEKFLPLYIPNLFRLYRKRRYDIVHTHLITSNLIAKPIAAAAGVPLRFNHDHANDLYRYKQKVRLWLDRAANRFTTHTIAVSTSTREFLLKFEGLPPERVSVIINGIDLERFHPAPERRAVCRKKWNLPEDAVVICGVGRLRYQKNFSLFLRVAARVVAEFPQTQFVIAGDGPDEISLRRQAHNLNIEKNVHFLGFVPDITELYPAVDMFFLPSRFEGTPMTILEAMAMQLAIVASRLDGIAEVLEDGEDAYLVASEDEEQFAGRILQLIREPAEMKRLSDAAYQKVRSNYSAEKMTRQVEDLYLHCLETKAKS